MSFAGETPATSSGARVAALVAGRLVCNSIGDGHAAPSVIRACSCGARLWVTRVMLPLVESGELTPVCRPCGPPAGRPIGIHPRTMDVLIQRGQVEQAWQIVNAMNAADEQCQRLNACE